MSPSSIEIRPQKRLLCCGLASNSKNYQENAFIDYGIFLSCQILLIVELDIFFFFKMDFNDI